MIAAALHEGRDGRREVLLLCDPVHIIRTEPVADGRSKASRSSKR